LRIRLGSIDIGNSYFFGGRLPLDLQAIFFLLIDNLNELIALGLLLRQQVA
jgi:hypothetical protein